MKAAVLLFAASLFPVSAMANVPYTGRGGYEGMGLNNNIFAENAAKYRAIDDAVRQCRTAGHAYCLFNSVALETSEYTEVSARAVVTGINVQGGLNVYTSAWNVTISAPEKKQMATESSQYLALEDALSDCQDQFRGKCAILSVSSDYYDWGGGEYRSQIRAEAQVAGSFSW